MVNRNLILAAGVLAVAAAIAPMAQAQSRRTVSYFLAHPEERNIILRECRDDEAAARMPECANAQRAADQASRQAYLQEQRQHRTQTPNEMLTDPAYYAANPIARAVVLDQCARGTARLSDCAAARAAGR